MKVSFSESGHQVSSERSKVIAASSVALKTANDLDVLIDKIGDANYVLLGEASHGTHEYYTWRTQISKKIDREKRVLFYSR